MRFWQALQPYLIITALLFGLAPPRAEASGCPTDAMPVSEHAAHHMHEQNASQHDDMNRSTEACCESACQCMLSGSSVALLSKTHMALQAMNPRDMFKPPVALHPIPNPNNLLRPPASI